MTGVLSVETALAVVAARPAVVSVSVAGVGERLVSAIGLLAVALVVLPRQRVLTRARLPGRGDTNPATPVGPWSARATAAMPALCGIATGLLAAVLVGGGGGGGVVVGIVVGAAALIGARRWITGPGGDAPTDPMRLAGAWDLLAACLRAGLPVATATRSVAEQLPGADGGVLATVADLLAIGADPAQAWEPAMAVASTAPLARAARRTARSGAAMADAVAGLATELRAAAADGAEERAQRAGVLITGPLGLCFLPAFFCLGVLPVVIGLAGQLIEHW